MNEAQTRFNKIDPKLRDAGWGIVPRSNILVEQSAYIAPGRITITSNKTPKKADFVLEYQKNMLKMEKCDLLDVLEYIAYNSTPMERAKRVELVKKQYVDALNKEQREFDNLILQYYINNGFKELGSDNLKTFITIKYNSMSDAKERLNMSVADIREHYFELQRRLYSA